MQGTWLRQMGFDFQAYTIDLYHFARDILRFLRTMTGASWSELIGTVRFGLALVDEIEKATLRLRPPNYDVMGAIGAAMLAREYATRNGGPTRFKGFESSQLAYTTLTFECKGCSNHCEIVGIKVDDERVARWGSRCGKWDVV